MNDHLVLSAAGANLIKHFEGLKEKRGDKYKSYICPAGVRTIGWGSTHHGGHDIDSDTIWTLEECSEAFAKDMREFEHAVRHLVKVPLEQTQFDALVSFAYNCGEGNLAKSTLLKKVNAKDFVGAADEFKRWNKGGGKVLAGLTRRRASEALLFQNIVDADYDGKPDKVIVPIPEPMPQAVDDPEG
jgi:lysozyme